MSDNTKIEWCEATWNPVTGCTKVSPGCDHCYAETFAERWRGTPGHHFEQGFDLTLRAERLDQPLRWKRPRRIFVNSMSDLFHDDIPDEYIAHVFAIMALAESHTFQVLTKRHGRMRSLLRDEKFAEEVQRYAVPQARLHGLNTTWAERTTDPRNGPLPNVWLGVSVENQKWADIRVPALLGTPAAVRWLSCEPLLGPIDLTNCAGVSAITKDWAGDAKNGTGAPHPFVDWVVVGGESGRSARPMHPDWARSLRDQCTAEGVPFLFKQHGEYVDPEFIETAGWDDRSFDEAGVTIWPDGHAAAGPAYGTLLDGSALLWRVGKKRAGRVLDGRTWDEYPAVST